MGLTGIWQKNPIWKIFELISQMVTEVCTKIQIDRRSTVSINYLEVETCDV